MTNDFLEQIRQIQERFRFPEIERVQKQVAAFRSALPVSQEILRSIERTTEPIRDIQKRTRRVNEAARSVGWLHKQIDEQFGFAFAQAVQVGAAIKQVRIGVSHAQSMPAGELSDLVGQVGRIVDNLQQVMPEDAIENIAEQNHVPDIQEFSEITETEISASNLANVDTENFWIIYQNVIATLTFLVFIWAQFYPNTEAITSEQNVTESNYFLFAGEAGAQEYRELPQPVEYMITADARLRTAPGKTNDAVIRLNRGMIFVVTERYGDWNGGHVVNSARKRVWGWAYRKYMVRKEPPNLSSR